MPTLRITTKSSIWTIDEDAKIVTRVPRNEDPTHPSLLYDLVGSPMEYEKEVEFFGDDPHERASIYIPSFKGRIHTGWIEQKEYI